jgi:hypothetical protein
MKLIRASSHRHTPIFFKYRDIFLTLNIVHTYSLCSVCECGAEKETIQHILEECPLTKFQQGFSKLHLLTEDALNWLQQIKNI